MLRLRHVVQNAPISVGPRETNNWGQPRLLSTRKGAVSRRLGGQSPTGNSNLETVCVER